ncbi:MAG: ion transporter [Candidatus Zixiibacteriota bacterium]|nr:MAG: ion transporter [candidate division Zixibacteria bacterium]
MKNKLKLIIEDSSTAPGRIFDIAIQLLILISLISFTLETLPDLSPRSYALLQTIELITVIVFTAEYLLRLWVADEKRTFVFSIYGFIDLLAILPFYLAAGVDLRSMRALRFLRLFRVLKLVRYSQAIQRFQKAFALAKEELILYMMSTCFVLYFAAVGIYYFEHDAQPDVFQSVPHSLWWAVATLTTVGYGDVYPVTPGGKFFTFIILMIGLGIVAVPAGLVASALTEVREHETTEQENHDSPP